MLNKRAKQAIAILLASGVVGFSVYRTPSQEKTIEEIVEKPNHIVTSNEVKKEVESGFDKVEDKLTIVNNTIKEQVSSKHNKEKFNKGGVSINKEESVVVKPVEKPSVPSTPVEPNKPSDDTTINKPSDNTHKPSDDTVVEKPIVPPTTNDTNKPSNDTVVEKPNKPSGDTTINKPSDNTTESDTYASFKNQVLELVNQERAKQGLKPLVMTDAKLSDCADAKAKDMVINNYFDHTSPTYGSVTNMINKWGISWRANGENIAKGQRTPQEVMNSWMNSSGHRANILNPNFTHIGIGIAKNSSGQLVWVQQFIGR